MLVYVISGVMILIPATLMVYAIIVMYPSIFAKVDIDTVDVNSDWMKSMLRDYFNEYQVNVWHICLNEDGTALNDELKSYIKGRRKTVNHEQFRNDIGKYIKLKENEYEKNGIVGIMLDVLNAYRV